MKKFLIVLIFNFSFLFAFGNTFEEDIFMESYEMQEAEKTPERAVIVQSMKISNIDPALMRDEYSKEIIPLVYETLFKINSQGDIEKCLVEKYSWISERELYLKLKSKIFFHDGTELTAEDVKNSLEFTKEKGVLKNMYSDITDIKILGKNEMKIKISDTDNTFLNTLAYGMSSIAKREKNKIYGTGKYKIEEVTGSETKLTEFKGSNEIKEIIYTWDINEKQRLIKLFNDYADIALNMSEETIKEGKKIGVVSEESIIFPSETIVSTVILFGKQNDFSLETKRAFEKAVRRKADTFFPKDILNANLSKIDISYKTKDIKKYFEDRENKKELKLMVLNTERNMKYAENIKKSLKESGIDVRILPHQIESYNAKLASKDFDLAVYDITALNNDLIFLMNKILLTDIENIELHNALQPFFKILKDEKDKKKREAVIDKMASLIHKNVPYVILEHYKYFTVVSPEFEKPMRNHKEGL